MNFQIDHMVRALGSSSGKERQKARRSLINVGNAAVPALIAALRHPQGRVRWEAAKSLSAIGDKTASPALTCALMDEDIQVQWVAAEALIAMGRAALKPLFEALIQDFDSVNLRHGAHHVLHDLKEADLLNASELALLKSLDHIGADVAVPIGSWKALNALVT